MEGSTVTQTGQPSEPGKGTRLPPSWLLWTIALVLLGAALVVRMMVGSGPAAPGGTAGPPQDPGWSVERPLGEVVRLTGGAVARVNGLEPDVTLAPGLPQPDPGTRLVRSDVEVCAGEEEHLADPAFWLGLGDDNRVHSPHMGVRDFRLFTLAPGTCQRGDVDLSLPEDVGLVGVLLMDSDHTTVGAWAAEGAPGEPEPLDSGIAPEFAEIGPPSELETTGSVVLREVVTGLEPERGAEPGTTAARIDGEVCADQQPLLTGAANWYLQLDDHRLVPASRDGATPGPAEVSEGTCAEATADFLVPAGARLAAVIYTYGGIYEEARWRVGR